MTGTMTYVGTLELDTCWCGITHAIPSDLKAKQRRDWQDGRQQTNIYCPLGHSYIISGESPLAAEQRRRERAERRAAAERDLREDTERRLRAQKGATTRARKRHAAALCPCCNRSFVQLRRHLATKHPDYDPTRA
jgi:hypothetical protein